MWKEFKKRSVTIRAIHFTDECKEMVFNTLREVQQNIAPSYNGGSPCLLIPTLEGEMIANLNDWVIQGIKGELYTCKPEIFEQTYEETYENISYVGS